MAGIPLTVALPAAAASLAYINARTGFTNDVRMLKNIFGRQRDAQREIDANTGNMFYKLESFAKAPGSADRPFLAVPPPLPKGELTLEQLRQLRPREWTYAQVYEEVLRYAAWLKNEHGVVKEDIVAMDIPNTPEFVFVWFGLWSLGARPAFINTGLRGEGLLHCIKISSAKLFIVDEDLTEALSDDVVAGLRGDAGKEIKAVILDKQQQLRIASMQGHRACDDCRKIVDANAMAQLIYTSGTTGLPKAAVISWRRYITSSLAISTYLNITPDTRYYTALPLYHTSASMLGVGIVLAAGASIIISPHFSPRTFIASIIASRANATQYIGEMCRYLLTMPPSPLDQAHDLQFVFGNGIRPDIWLKFKERYAIPSIREFYGATESPSSTFITSNNNFGEGAIGRSGVLIRALRRKLNVMVRHDVETGEPFRDPETGLCQRVNVGEPGEMLAWLDPVLTKDSYVGYWGNDKATTGKILRDVLVKGDLYFRTGDLLRADRDGRMFFVDRIGDTFRWKGENVSTGEVEKIVALHPSIKEANVYGVQLPGHDGRAGCAAVVFHNDPDERSLRDLADYVRKSLPRFAAPLFLRNVPSMATTGTSKYQKHGLRTQGVEPDKVGEDRLFWLDPKAGAYKSFGQKEWQDLVAGQTKL
ncbi:acetyl-CoA synthetase-like protein [Myriangium duriaei CBS 260.36]|uniref:Very long-chain fatty acid transport protein n=1 Tax=Myriangium duriaei CBS 260.36 TaxID=1168546 RepID=A0A9P4MLP8_9PEZI|nr:acetyl-CoA synthetase-like protein [Myriangium duriaei CBS 260.36]